MLWVLLIAFGITFLVMQQAEILKRDRRIKVLENREQNLTTDLLNRLTAGDMPAYERLTVLQNQTRHSTIPTTNSSGRKEIIGLDDQSEIDRLHQRHGIGYPVLDEASEPEDYAEYIKDLTGG